MATSYDKLLEFARLVEQDTREHFAKHYPDYQPDMLDRDCAVRVVPGKKYTKIDVGSSGKYMVDEHDTIYGIKGYGVIHRGHVYGTLDTIQDWYWGGYVAVPKGGA